MNTANGSVTIYHYDEEKEIYLPAHYKKSSIYHGSKTIAKDGGFVSTGVCKIRIPTSERIDISTDDYIFLGLTNEPINKEKCLKVNAFGDNRRGTLPHWRIECLE